MATSARSRSCSAAAYINNHNHLLGSVPGVDGLKTGFTNASGYNIAISGVRDNRRLIVVVMGGPTTASRDQNAEDLLLTGFDVMRRRAMGEKITVAQNLFEPEPTGPVIRSGVEQGDADQDGLKIELASAPPSRASRVDIVQPKNAKPAAKEEPRKARWAVQVGAFKSKTDAATRSRWSTSASATTSTAPGARPTSRARAIAPCSPASPRATPRAPARP